MQRQHGSGQAMCPVARVTGYTIYTSTSTCKIHHDYTSCLWWYNSLNLLRSYLNLKQLTWLGGEFLQPDEAAGQHRDALAVLGLGRHRSGALGQAVSRCIFYSHQQAALLLSKALQISGAACCRVSRGPGRRCACSRAELAYHRLDGGVLAACC